MTFLEITFWTIFISIVSSATTYLFMKYGTFKNMILNLTDFTEEDLKKWKS